MFNLKSVTFIDLKNSINECNQKLDTAMRAFCPLGWHGLLYIMSLLLKQSQTNQSPNGFIDKMYSAVFPVFSYKDVDLNVLHLCAV